MELRLASVMVDDQDKALSFYVEKLGFVKSKDIPMGQFRWLTVTAPEGADGVELLLEPMGFPPAVTFSAHCSKPEYQRPHSYLGTLQRSTTNSRSGVSAFVGNQHRWDRLLPFYLRTRVAISLIWSSQRPNHPFQATPVSSLRSPTIAPDLHRWADLRGQ